MIFCPKCGSLLMPKTVKGETKIACSCGYSEKGASGAAVVKEVVKHKEEVKHVIEEGADEKKLPSTKAECPECGYDKAFWWTKQTRAGDEPETRFLKCEKCKHTWREYK